MKYLLIISITIFSSCIPRQIDISNKEKKEAFNVLKLINSDYKNNKNISVFFTQKILCVICDNATYEENYFISYKDLSKNDISTITSFLDYNLIKNEDVHFNKKDEKLLMSYVTEKPNSKTGFEGSSALITFKRENEILKIYGIETIP